MRLSCRTLIATLASTLALALTISRAPDAYATPDTFFTVPQEQIDHADPGDVLRTREIVYHLAGIPTPIRVSQLMYRSIDALGHPVANATSILHPLVQQAHPRAVAYNSIYDSLNPDDSPSRMIAGRISFSGALNAAEASFLADLVGAGYTVIVSDIEGPHADFGAGPEYAAMTLDGIRAASRATTTGITASTPVALMGYSGGSIATGWAASLAPTYAPDVNRRLVGATTGGVFVTPRRNLEYVDGSLGWVGVAMMAIKGLTRAYHVDPAEYLNARGRALMTSLSDDAIPDVIYRYPLLTWRDIARPEYASFDKASALVDITDRVDLARQPTPTIPLMVVEGSGGDLTGTNGHKPGIGAGDEVMVTGDVRSLVHRYCATDRQVEMIEIPWASHSVAMQLWAPMAVTWLTARFDGLPAPSTCATTSVGGSSVGS